MDTKRASREHRREFRVAKTAWLLLVAGGVAIAAAAGERFRDLGDGTVQDRETGLVWLREVEQLGTLSWEEAVKACQHLAAAGVEGLRDRSKPGTWRLPTAHELLTLTRYGLTGGAFSTNTPFAQLNERQRRSYFWSSTETGYITNAAFRVDIRGSGKLFMGGKEQLGFAWPVKGSSKRLAQHEGRRPDLSDSFASLTKGEQERAEFNDLYDVAGLRLKREFVALKSAAFLEPPPGFPQYRLGDYVIARQAPEVKLQVLPEMVPEYFPEGEAYQAGWANWAAITRSDDGRLIMAAGDHRGKGAQINIYAYTPGGRRSGGRLERVLDLTAALGWHGGMYTDGKVHGHLDVLPDGTLWGATHHGPYPQESWYDVGYRGSWFFNFNLNTAEFENLGVPIIGQSLPNCRLDRERGIFFANGDLTPNILVYDTKARRTLLAGAPPNGWKWGSRGVMLDEATGHFWGIETSEKPYRFISYDPARNRFKRHDDEVPLYEGAKEQTLHGAWATGPDSEGRYYTDFGGVFTRFRPDWERGMQMERLGVTGRSESFPVLQMALSPDKRFVYWTPRADDTMALMQYEIATGRIKIIGFLSAAIRQQFGLFIGNGVWGLNITADGGTVAILENGGFGQPFWGHPVLLLVEVPAGERR